jgi:hypothetical protein
VRPSLPIESINIRRPAAGPMNGMVIETDVDDSPINYPAQIRRWHKSRWHFIYLFFLFTFFAFFFTKEEKKKKKIKRRGIERGADTGALFLSPRP